VKVTSFFTKKADQGRNARTARVATCLPATRQHRTPLSASGRTEATLQGAGGEPGVGCTGARVSPGKIFLDLQALAFNGFYTNYGIQKSIRRDT
jgi:hypothetical protein